MANIKTIGRTENLTTGADIYVLGQTIYGEARGETHDGKVAVGWVIRNRAADARWPDTIEKVCRQKAQFSCWNASDPNRERVIGVTVDDPAFRECLHVSIDVLSSKGQDPTKGANHYLTKAMAERSPPKWYDASKITKTIGAHVFLKLCLACLMLSGCGTLYGGVTMATFEGEMCGAPVKMTVQDGKERASFKVVCTTPGGGSATVETTDSRAFEGQAGANAVISQSLTILDKLVAPGAGP